MKKTVIVWMLFTFSYPEADAQLYKVFEQNPYFHKKRFHNMQSLSVDKPNGQYFLNLQSLDQEGYERFEMLDQDFSGNDHSYKVVHLQPGKAWQTPNHVIYAEWAVEDARQEQAFIDSRKELFQLRQTHLPGFSFDVLLENTTQKGRYLIIGFYQDEAGLGEARHHPAIREWAQQHPASAFSARELSELQTFKMADHRFFVTDTLQSWFPIGDENHPSLQKACRYLPLVGGDYPDWDGIPQQEVLMGLLELKAGELYPGHRHPAPEIYYVLEGEALWTVNTDTSRVRSGMSIYHPPYAVHTMENTGSITLKVLYFWWAPFGDVSRFEGYEFVE